MRRWIRRIWIGCGLMFVLWLAWNAQAHGVNDSMLASTDQLTISDSANVVQFWPANAQNASRGLLFLPGAMVEPKAYVPLLRAVAEAGHPVVMVKLPWRMARSVSDQANVWGGIAGVLARHPNREWVLAGHSRGAALAAQFSETYADKLDGLVLIGTTHPKRSSLASLTIPVTKVYGTRDCVADSAAVHANAVLLPPTTTWVRLDGANHGQFGWYGSQLGDCKATMSRVTQQARTLDALVQALRRE